MGVKKILDSNQAVLLIVPSTDYNKVMIDTLKELSGESICYVTLNKTYDGFVETCKKNKIKMDKIGFIDAISKSFKKSPTDSENVYYISSPGALTELSLVIGKFLEHDFKYFVFDSITNLGIYHKQDICSKFSSSLVNKIKGKQTKAVFYAIGSRDDSLVKQVGMFVDEVVDYNKK